jgi:flavodoxin
MNPMVVVYYSRTGVTRHVAERLASILKADIEEIREAADRSGVLGYIKAGYDAVKHKEATLISKHSAADRKVVVLGMPVWGFNPPPAVRAYLSAVKLEGVKVCGFATMNGSGAGKTLERVAEIVPGGLALRLPLKRPKTGDVQLEATLREWAGQIKDLG